MIKNIEIILKIVIFISGTVFLMSSLLGLGLNGITVDTKLNLILGLVLYLYARKDL